MTNTIAGSVILLAVSLLAVSSLPAQEFQAPSERELRMTAEPLAPGAPAIILQRRVTRDDNGRSHEDNYLRLKILTEEGRKYADVQIRYLQGLADVVDIRARTIEPDGSIKNFDGKVFERSLVRGRGLNVLAKTFTFPDVRVGSVLEYSYTIDLRGYIYDSHWILNSDLFTKNAQFSLTPLRSTSVPMSLRWTLKDVPMEAQPEQGMDRVIRMEVNNLSAFQEEDFAPPDNELKSRVDFVYQAAGESDPDQFWKSVAKRRGEALEHFLGKRNPMEEAVRQIVLPDDSPETKLRKIYTRVQELRNTSYELEKTEKEQKRAKEKVAQNAADVWKHGYGNAFELPWLFLGLVRAAGFEAYGCWVASRSEYFFNPKLMESDALRFNIVLVKLNGKDVYLDPGAAFAPFALLPWNETATPGICLDTPGGTWIRTPLPSSAESQTRRTATFRLASTGDLQGKVTVTYTGMEAMYRRVEVRNDDPVARKKFLEEQVKAQIPVAAQVELTKPPDWDSADKPFIAEFSLNIANWAANAGRRLLLPAAIFSAGSKHVFERAERIHPIYYSYPYGTSDEVIIELPPQWQVAATPGPRAIKGNSVAYSMQVEGNSNTVRITRQFAIDVFLMEQQAYPTLRGLFQRIRSSDDEPIVVQPAGAGPAP